MIRPLIIDDSVKESLKSLANHAAKNPYSTDDLLDLMNKQIPPPGDLPEFVRELPFGYRVVFTIEHQPVGNVRHLSMSVDSPDMMPNVESVKAVMEILGFDSIENCKIYPEDLGSRQAINILEIFEKN